MAEYKQLEMDLGIPKPNFEDLLRAWSARIYDFLDRFQRIATDLDDVEFDELLLRLEDVLDEFENRLP